MKANLNINNNQFNELLNNNTAQTPQKIDDLAALYLNVCDRIQNLEKIQQELRSQIINSLNIKNTATYESQFYKISLSNCSRENINVKAAKSVLGDLIKPFLSTTAYTRLNVKRIG